MEEEAKDKRGAIMETAEMIRNWLAGSYDCVEIEEAGVKRITIAVRGNMVGYPVIRRIAEKTRNDKIFVVSGGTAMKIQICLD